MLRFSAAGDSESESEHSFDIGYETDLTNFSAIKGIDSRNIEAPQQKTEICKNVLQASNDLVILSDLQNAVINGNVSLISQLIDTLPNVCNALLGSGWTALMYAANFGKVDIVKKLLDANADVNFCGPSGCTALMVACKSHCEDLSVISILQLLLSSGACLKKRDNTGKTALMYAARSEKCNRLNVLLPYCTELELNMQDNQGWSAMDWAISRDHCEIIQSLTRAGCQESHVSRDANIKSTLDCITEEKQRVGDHWNVAQKLESPKEDQKADNINCVVSKVEMNEEPEKTYEQYGQLELLLAGLELSELIETFHKHDVKFEQLLCFTMEDLCALGVTQHGVKLRILKAVKDWNVTEWKESSLPNFTDSAVNYSNIQAILRTTKDHIQYLSGSLRFVRNQLHTHPHILVPQASVMYEKNPHANINEKTDEILVATHELCCSLKCLKTEMIRLTDLENDLSLCQVDHIKKHSNCNSSFVFIGSFLVIFGLLGAKYYKNSIFS